MARRREWRDRLSWLTPAGRARSKALRASLLDAFAESKARKEAAAVNIYVDAMVDRVSVAIADQVLRAAWSPVVGVA